MWIRCMTGKQQHSAPHYLCNSRQGFPDYQIGFPGLSCAGGVAYGRVRHD